MSLKTVRVNKKMQKVMQSFQLLFLLKNYPCQKNAKIFKNKLKLMCLNYSQNCSYLKDCKTLCNCKNYVLKNLFVFKELLLFKRMQILLKLVLKNQFIFKVLGNVKNIQILIDFLLKPGSCLKEYYIHRKNIF